LSKRTDLTSNDNGSINSTADSENHDETWTGDHCAKNHFDNDWRSAGGSNATDDNSHRKHVSNPHEHDNEGANVFGDDEIVADDCCGLIVCCCP
jgi:hypothetical protein